MTLRTNSKKAITNLRSYIVENLGQEVFDELVDSKEYQAPDKRSSFDVAADFIYFCFKREMLEHNLRYKAGRVSELELFESWAQGLPSAFNFDYYLGGQAIDDLGNILEETEEERNGYSYQQAEELLTYLIYREVKKSVNGYKCPLNDFIRM